MGQVLDSLVAYDISPALHDGIAVWPGDRAFRYTQSFSISQGDHIDLGSIDSTLHVGAHADAPSHYQRNSASIDEVSLDYYFGPCQVITIEKACSNGRILPEHIEGKPISTARILLKTNSFSTHDKFNESFFSLSPELVKYFSLKGVCLVGIDTPSVDPFDDKVLLSHKEILKLGMRNLEGVILSDVPDGSYWLSALPLRLKGADASPVRAALFSMNHMKDSLLSLKDF
ncbi:MAG: hypothetical protein COT74_14155 [Bdellovibrionales bacterium CG10_big_fil_rev_8_21_14_0_10_45_34]|nr:MAG: hypothetical protein COT74_14155 [Bdellovibrionales bacterium CG10_big_fil_rev_8_21_14_0_10_45_34]